MQNSCRKHPSIYQSIYDLKTEQHANIIFAEKAEAGTIKIVKRALYEEIDEQLQNLVAHFNIYPRKEYFKKVRALFNFKIFINKLFIFIMYKRLNCRELNCRWAQMSGLNCRFTIQNKCKI